MIRKREYKPFLSWRFASRLRRRPFLLFGGRIAFEQRWQHALRPPPSRRKRLKAPSLEELIQDLGCCPGCDEMIQAQIEQRNRPRKGLVSTRLRIRVAPRLNGRRLRIDDDDARRAPWSSDRGVGRGRLTAGEIEQTDRILGSVDRVIALFEDRDDPFFDLLVPRVKELITARATSEASYLRGPARARYFARLDILWLLSVSKEQYGLYPERVSIRRVEKDGERLLLSGKSFVSLLFDQLTDLEGRFPEARLAYLRQELLDFLRAQPVARVRPNGEFDEARANGLAKPTPAEIFIRNELVVIYEGIYRVPVTRAQDADNRVYGDFIAFAEALFRELEYPLAAGSIGRALNARRGRVMGKNARKRQNFPIRHG
jgi:hypothetical protein